MKTLYKISLLIAVILMTACRTTIPPRDTVDPTFNLLVQGDGISEDINQDFDFDNSVLYLKRGARYRWILTFNDPGGLKELTMELPNNSIIALGEETVSGTWLIESISDPYRIRYKWEGYETDPVKNGLVSFGRVDAIGGPLDGTVPNYELEIMVTDFKENTVDKTLIIRITNEDSRIGSRD